MADQYSYFTPEFMQDKKLSDLRTNKQFLQDGVNFLKSGRKGYTDEDIKGMSADDVVSEVLEHFRYQSTNEVTVAKDIYFMNDDSVDIKQRESFGRLMFAFDNAKGEGLWDRGGEKIGDYLGGVFTAPSTYASAVAGVGSAGTGAAAIQASKAASLAALRTAGKKIIKRSLVAGMADGAVGAAFEYGNQKVRESAAEDLDMDYEVDKGAVALSGALGFAVGAGTYGAGAALQHRGAKKLAETIDQGRVANADRVKEAAAIAAQKVRDAAKDPAKKAKMEAATKTVLQAIDPSLVSEGNLVKRYLLSNDLPEGVTGGLSQETIQRLSAASYELAERIGADISKPDVRITEVLAENIGKNKEIFTDVAKQYGLTPRQLSAAYAAEVSQAAKILATQSAISKTARRSQLEALSKKVDDLFEAGMAPAKAEDLQVIADANRKAVPLAWKNFKEIENARRMFMTSQPATTMRNNIFSVAMTGIDIVDQLNQSVLNTITKGRKEGRATLRGSLDNLKYLTRDNYVADALVTMLQSEAPEKFQKVFFDAALVESHVVKDSLLSKAGAAANTLNTMSDFVVKRAIIAGNIDRQLKQMGNEELGTSVMDMLRKGTVTQLPDDVLNNAIDESLAFTFQRRFGGKDASGMNRAAAETIQFIHNYGFTTIIPFPRYLASQAKFVSDYTGLTLARRISVGQAPVTDEVARAMTGGMMAYGIWNVRKEYAAKGYEWGEVEGDDGKPYDGQSAFGPLAPVVYAMDYLARYTEGLPMKEEGTFLRELAVIMGSTEFRPGTGIMDAIDKAVKADSIEPLIEEVGNYASSFTYPAAVVKDFYGQFDPRSSYLPETRDASISTFDLYGYDFNMSLYQRITRHLPDFDSAKISNQLEESLGISIAPDTLAKTLEFANTSTRTYYQTQYTKDADGNNMRQDAIRFDIFGDGPIKMQDPIVKQITGFVGRPPKNALQREMSRLQIDPFKLYNPYREQNQALELFTQQKMQGNLAARVEKLMEQDQYKNATDEQKRVLLVGKEGVIPRLITMYRKDAENDLKKMARMPEAQQDYMSYIRGEFNALGGKSKQQADVMWEIAAPKYGYEGMSIKEALDSVDTNTDFTTEEKDIYKTNLRKRYIDLSK
ncbi:hypothetical protein CRP2_gp44 [Roseobacter phage CRP-2]|nr:hypothetical protein CRP2_gp44 [Roseobacter phage CRP-2]